MKTVFYVRAADLKLLGTVVCGSLDAACRMARRRWGSAVFDVSH